MSKSAASTSRILSTWTPLNNEENNRKIFSERRELVCKWYERWSEFQRRKILSDLLKLSSQSELAFVDEILAQKLPPKEQDFTRLLPQVLSLYIFSYLDPKTLCRCAQVCWHWKNISEHDQLWMLKCTRLGWTLSFTPGPFERGLWKKNYIENLKHLQYLKMQIDRKKECQTPSTVRSDDILIPDDRGSLTPTSHRSIESMLSHSSKHARKPPAKPAWRGSDPTPKDTWRYNYLNNDDHVEIVKSLRAHGMSGPKSASISAKAKAKVQTRRPSLNTKSQSLTNLKENTSSGQKTLEEQIYPNRPDWARPAANAVLSEQTGGRNQTIPEGLPATNAPALGPKADMGFDQSLSLPVSSRSRKDDRKGFVHKMLNPDGGDSD